MNLKTLRALAGDANRSPGKGLVPFVCAANSETVLKLLDIIEMQRKGLEQITNTEADIDTVPIGKYVVKIHAAMVLTRVNQMESEI